MPFNLSLYSALPTTQPALVKTRPDAVPPTEDLESAYAELEMLRKLSAETFRKVGEDRKSMMESLRRMIDKEKGKAKVIEKVKRERDCTCILPVCVF